MAVDCSFFRSSTALTVSVPFCTTNGSGLLFLPHVNGFHDGLHAVLLRGWQWIAYTSARQPLSRRFLRSFAQRMAADCSFFLSSMAFTVSELYFSAYGSGLLILPLVKGFPDGLCSDFLRGLQCLARSSARQWLSQFARRIAQRMAADR